MIQGGGGEFGGIGLMPNRKERRWAGKRRAKSGKRVEKRHEKEDERKENGWEGDKMVGKEQEKPRERVGEWREKDGE